MVQGNLHLYDFVENAKKNERIRKKDQQIIEKKWTNNVNWYEVK